MKRIFFKVLIIIAFTFTTTIPSLAQKVGYMNTQTVLAQIPEYAVAQQTLEKLGNQYKEYLTKESAKVDEAYLKYQSERARLTESQRIEREDEIVAMERAVKEKQNEYFGEKGAMATKSEELMAPIKNKVNEAVKKVASQYGYTLILDISAIQGVIYKDDNSDLSLEIIKNL